jgi:hypothetical protein
MGCKEGGRWLPLLWKEDSWEEGAEANLIIFGVFPRYLLGLLSPSCYFLLVASTNVPQEGLSVSLPQPGQCWGFNQ